MADAPKARRRGRGEGMLANAPRADGLWTASLLLPNGKRKWFYGRTRAEAARKLKAAREEAARGLPVGSSVKVGPYLLAWLDQVAKPKVRPRTYDHYHLYVTKHLIPALGGYRLSALRPVHVQAMLTAELAQGTAPRTVHHLRAILRNALNVALRWGLVAQNAAALAEPVTVQALEREPMTTEMVRAILAAVRGDPWEPLYVLAACTGLRQSELLGLTWADVDLDGAALTVRHQLQRRERAYHLVAPKTTRSRRALPLPQDAVELLRMQAAVQHTWRELREGDWGNDWDLVFTYADGAPLAHASVTHRFQALLLAAGLPRLRFHDLRVAHNTLLAELGVDLAVRMARLGHVTTDMSIHYTTAIPSAQRDATDRLAAALWGGG